MQDETRGDQCGTNTTSRHLALQIILCDDRELQNQPTKVAMEVQGFLCPWEWQGEWLALNSV